MNKRKMIAYIIGATFAAAFILGLILLVASKGITVSIAITIICLSLASGLIAPNPISFVGLIAGICMLVFPPWIVGVVFIVIGVAGAVINALTANRYLNHNPV